MTKDPRSATCWANIKLQTKSKFGDGLSWFEMSDQFDLRQSVALSRLFERLQETTNVRFDCLVDFAPFTAQQLHGVFVKVRRFRLQFCCAVCCCSKSIDTPAEQEKYSYTVSRIAADASVELARLVTDAGESKRLLHAAQEKYSRALQTKPDDSEVLTSLLGSSSSACIFGCCSSDH